MMEIVRDRVGSTDSLLTDFGIVSLDAKTAATLRAVPHRKNGAFDRRYSASRAAMAWQASVNKAVLEFWRDGGDILEFRPESIA